MVKKFLAIGVVPDLSKVWCGSCKTNILGDIQSTCTMVGEGEMSEEEKEAGENNLIEEERSGVERRRREER